MAVGAKNDEWYRDAWHGTRTDLLSRNLHATLGASEQILLHPLSLSSAATTPFTRVPRSSRCRTHTLVSSSILPLEGRTRQLTLLFNSTAALSSNLIHLPSGLRVSFFVRTTTALLTSPLRTLLAIAALVAAVPVGIGRAFLMTTTISSPAARNAVVTFQLWRKDIMCKETHLSERGHVQSWS